MRYFKSKNQLNTNGEPTMTNVQQSATFVQMDGLKQYLEELYGYIQGATTSGLAVHEVEQGLWSRMLQIGHRTLEMFFAMTGVGDLGETVTLPNGRVVRRLEKTHKREYVSIFGTFQLERTVYGTRVGQKIEFVPTDNRLQLPRGKFSYLLQDWNQSLAVENSYAQVNETLEKILGWGLSTDSLERTTRFMGAEVSSFWESETIGLSVEEESIIVASADGKGVPIRVQADTAPILEHKPARGPKPNRKKMATVGTVYTIAPFKRHPEEVVDSLFKQPEIKVKKKRDSQSRSHPKNKKVRAALNLENEGDPIKGSSVIFEWMATQLQERNSQNTKKMVTIMDGQESLWNQSKFYLKSPDQVEVLDLLHVTPRIWTAAHLFCEPDSPDAISFVKDYVLMILKGQTPLVIQSWQSRAKSRGFKGQKMKVLEQIIGYFQKNQERMRYDIYLAEGYPIASGVIEGACRHLVKDRLERTGMRWTIPGAQAMLNLRSTYINGDWDKFNQWRIQKEAERLYPHQNLVKIAEWPLLA
ncbi:ISKra4 family transposase [Oscillatoria sp. HE19RPO]|uniref:ISKra4 family transposase n=1 Tax=Oscillatoria sp. HE19RPO TaxID=2954806 RepID=UPI0020C46E1C|nr:ISKra4 family transposase [Oscillatoria sp. HE19RPO]